jgi:hypothetical protein
MQVSGADVTRLSRRLPRRLSAGLVVVVSGLALAGCAEVETEVVAGYQPAKVEPLEGSDDVKRVTFTAEGAKRTGLETAEVRDDGDGVVVPYAAVIYDPEGKTFVYTSAKPLTYVREEVTVERIEGDWAFLTDGPPARTEVVTVGVAEVYGAELEIGGGH